MRIGFFYLKTTKIIICFGCIANKLCRNPAIMLKYCITLSLFYSVIRIKSSSWLSIFISFMMFIKLTIRKREIVNLTVKKKGRANQNPPNYKPKFNFYFVAVLSFDLRRLFIQPTFVVLPYRTLACFLNLLYRRLSNDKYAENSKFINIPFLCL